MTLPIGFWDISLLLALIAIILLAASEILSPHYGKVNILINWKRLRNAALTASIIFLITVAIRIINMLLT